MEDATEGGACAPALGGPSQILLAYIDESFTTDQFYLGVVVVDAESACKIETELDAIVAEYVATFDLDPDIELHGYHLFQGEDDWASVPTRARINIFTRATRTIGESGARVILRGMNVKRQRERYGPNAWPAHEVVLGHTLERINTLAAARRDWALVLADEVHNDERHRTNFRDSRRFGTPGYRSSTLPRLIDTIHFGPSHFSRLLQAADLVTFMHRRRCTVTKTDPRAQRANDLIWAGIEPAIEHLGFWEP